MADATTTEWEMVVDYPVQVRRILVPSGWLYEVRRSVQPDVNTTFVPHPPRTEAQERALIIQGVAMAHAVVKAVTMPIDAEASTDPLQAMDELLARLTAMP